MDLDAFFCAVEELRDPTLHGKPFAVGGKPDERGVVSSCSYAARLKGVRSAMPMGRVIKLCPNLKIVPADHQEYERVSNLVMDLLQSCSPTVEQISIDEAFLDASDPLIPGADLARQIQKRINNELLLPCSLGVATNKLVAKIANNVGKAASRINSPPNAITVVPPGEEATFLAPLPVEALWGVGPKTAERLSALNILTIGDLAAADERILSQLFGKIGKELHLHALGFDESPLITRHELKSISQETTFNIDTSSEIILRRTLLHLCELVGKRLRQHHVTAKTIKLKIRWSDFQTLTRQVTIDIPTDQDTQIYQSVMNLFNIVWHPGMDVRLVGVGASKLRAVTQQLSLWETSPQIEINDNGENYRRLQSAIDEIQDRFGSQSLTRGPTKMGINDR